MVLQRRNAILAGDVLFIGHLLGAYQGISEDARDRQVLVCLKIRKMIEVIDCLVCLAMKISGEMRIPTVRRAEEKP